MGGGGGYYSPTTGIKDPGRVYENNGEQGVRAWIF